MHIACNLQVMSFVSVILKINTYIVVISKVALNACLVDLFFYFYFKYYNVWLSLAGFALCVSIMFLIDWKSSLITFCIIFALYLIVVYRKPGKIFY